MALPFRVLKDRSQFASVAQSAEHRIRNAGVGGSSPPVGYFVTYLLHVAAGILCGSPVYCGLGQ